MYIKLGLTSGDVPIPTTRPSIYIRKELLLHPREGKANPPSHDTDARQEGNTEQTCLQSVQADASLDIPMPPLPFVAHPRSDAASPPSSSTQRSKRTNFSIWRDVDETRSPVCGRRRLSAGLGRALRWEVSQYVSAHWAGQDPPPVESAVPFIENRRAVCRQRYCCVYCVHMPVRYCKRLARQMISPLARAGLSAFRAWPRSQTRCES